VQGCGWSEEGRPKDPKKVVLNEVCSKKSHPGPGTPIAMAIIPFYL